MAIQRMPFSACEMHPAIIIVTTRSLWTCLRGRYHVPQNVFLALVMRCNATKYWYWYCNTLKKLYQYWYWQYLLQAILVLVLPILFKSIINNPEFNQNRPCFIEDTKIFWLSFFLDTVYSNTLPLSALVPSCRASLLFDQQKIIPHVCEQLGQSRYVKVKQPGSRNREISIRKSDAITMKSPRRYHHRIGFDLCWIVFE